MLRLYFAMFLVVSFLAQTTSANRFHDLLRAANVDSNNFIEKMAQLEHPRTTLSEADESGLTVLGCAVVTQQRKVVEWLLTKGFVDIGPSGEGKTPAEFAKQWRLTHIHVFLAYYEYVRGKGFSIDESIKTGREELKKFLERVEQVNSAKGAICPIKNTPVARVAEKLLWPDTGGYRPDLFLNHDLVFSEVCADKSLKSAATEELW